MGGQGLGEQIQKVMEKEFTPKALREKIKKIYNSERFSGMSKT